MHNVQFFQKRLKKKTKLLTMIKASGYGSGATQIASLLEKSKVDYFGVAYIDEGVALRKKGISKPIMVLNSHAPAFQTLIDFNLEPVIFSLSQLRELTNLLPINQYLNVHLKIDTGMRRLGFVENELEVLTKILLDAKSQIKVQSIYTHLAASDVPEEDEFSLSQLKTFDKAYRFICCLLYTSPSPRDRG